MVDFCVITFGGEVTVVNEWSNIESIKGFFPKGTKPIGAAMKKSFGIDRFKKSLL